MSAVLQGEDAVVVDEAGEPAAERQHLSQQPRHRRGIVVAREDAVADALQAQQAPADAGGLEEKGLHLVSLQAARSIAALGHQHSLCFSSPCFGRRARSDEHTSALPSLMPIPYVVFRLKTQK